MRDTPALSPVLHTPQGTHVKYIADNEPPITVLIDQQQQRAEALGAEAAAAASASAAAPGTAAGGSAAAAGVGQGVQWRALADKQQAAGSSPRSRL